MTLTTKRASASARGSFLGKELPTGLRLAGGNGPQGLSSSRLKSQCPARPQELSATRDTFSLFSTIYMRGRKAGRNFSHTGSAHPWNREREKGLLHMILPLRRVEK